MSVGETIGRQQGGIRGFAGQILERYGSAQGILFLLPTLALLSLLLFYPIIVDGLLLSFQDFTLSARDINPWVGLQNYKYWLIGGGSNLFLFSLKMTALYGLVVVPFDLVVALGAALLMNESLPARPLWRGIMLAGYASPPVAAGITFGIMAQAAEYGVLYNWLNIFFQIPASGGITQNTPWAFWGVILAKVWRDFGFMYVVFLAAVQSIPSELYEISKVDGAGPIQRFRHITLPHIRTVLITVVMIRMVFTVGKLAIPWAMTKGGPANYTSFLGVVLFEEGFVKWNLGRAAALGIMFALTIIPLILLWIRWETEDY